MNKPEQQWQGTVAYFVVALAATMGFLYSLVLGDMQTVTICLFLVLGTMAIVRSIHAHN